MSYADNGIDPEAERSPSPGEIAGFTARLRELSGRLARFERVDQDELDAFQADKADILDRIEGGAQ